MLRKHHLVSGLFFNGLIGVLLFISYMLFELPVPTIAIYDAIAACIVGTSLGVMWCDWDIDLNDGKLGKHRHTITHSALMPFIVTIVYMFASNYAMTLLMFFIILGVANHLFIDIIPGSVPSEYKTFGERLGYRADQIRRGKIGGSFKGPLAPKSDKAEKRWLLSHGMICILFALILFLKIWFHVDLL